MSSSQAKEMLAKHDPNLKADTVVQFYKDGKITKADFNSYHNYMWERYPNSEYTNRMNQIWGDVPPELREYVVTHFSKGAMNNFGVGDLIELVTSNGINLIEGLKAVGHAISLWLGWYPDRAIENAQLIDKDVLTAEQQQAGYKGIKSIDLDDQNSTIKGNMLYVGNTTINLENFKQGDYYIYALPGNVINISGNTIKNADYISALEGDGLYAGHFDYRSRGSFTIVDGTNELIVGLGWDVSLIY